MPFGPYKLDKRYHKMHSENSDTSTSVTFDLKVASNYLAKTASKSVHPFGWNFVHRQTDTHTHTHTHTDKLQ